MRIVDVNCFVGIDLKEIRPEVTPEELLARMEVSGVTQSVTYYTLAEQQIRLGNEEMDRIAAASGGKILSCWIASPYMDGVQMPLPEDYLKLLREKRPAAVRLDPVNQLYPFDSFFCDELLAVLDELRIPTIVTHGKGKGAFTILLQKLPEIAAQFPHIPFILTNASHTTELATYMLLKKRPNVYFATGFFCGAGMLDQCVERFGADRFLFGSSVNNIAAGSLGLVYMGRFADSEKEKIFHGNWDRLQEGIKWGS